MRSERAVGPQTVRPPVEREERIVVAYFGRELRHFSARHIGRIRHHQVERTGKAAGEIAGNKGRARGKAEALGIFARDREGAVRLSPHLYNTADELQRVAEILDRALA